MRLGAAAVGADSPGWCVSAVLGAGLAAAVLGNENTMFRQLGLLILVSFFKKTIVILKIIKLINSINHY